MFLISSLNLFQQLEISIPFSRFINFELGDVNWNFNHPKNRLLGVLKDLVHRVYVLCDKTKLSTRIHEREKSCKVNLSGIQPNLENDNGIPFHCATTGHQFLFELTKILAKGKNEFRRKIDNSWNSV